MSDDYKHGLISSTKSPRVHFIMAVTVRVAPTHQVGFVRYAGNTELPDLLDGVYSLLDHPDWKPGYDMVWDFQDISALVMDTGDVDHLLSVLRDVSPQLGNGRSAVIATRRVDYMFATLILLKAEDSPREGKVFESTDAALRWLTASDAPSATTSAADTPVAQAVGLLRRWVQGGPSAETANS